MDLIPQIKEKAKEIGVTAQDNFWNYLTKATQTLPHIVGNEVVIATIVPMIPSLIYDSVKQKLLEKHVPDLGNRLSAEESTLNFEFIHSLEGRKLFQETISQILEQTSEDKIEFYKKLLINAYTLPDPDIELIISYKRILDTLQITDIVILKNLHSPNYVCRKILENNKTHGGNMVNFDLRNHMWKVLNIDERLFQKLLIKLESDNLIHEESSDRSWPKGGYRLHDLEEGVRNMSAGAHNILTDYGLGFIQFIVTEK